MIFFSEKKFKELSHKRKHQIAASLLRELWEKFDEKTWSKYRKISDWLELSPIPQTIPAMSDRYHHHLKESKIMVKESGLLPKVRKKDIPSQTPFLEVSIYLENLRSSFNVGSILRTTEAFRLGKVYFSSQTPAIDNKKVKETSMGAFAHLSCQKGDLKNLPRPYIALETIEGAPSIFSFAFPSSFTLILGNEEYGIKEETLLQTDHCLQIPLVGWKNSLNVASAFAIAASQIHYQLRKAPCKTKI